MSIDSTKLASYEASVPKSKIVDDGTNPNWGMKRDTNGNNIRWFGWKLHVLCDSKSELPIEVLVTPANVYDGTPDMTLNPTTAVSLRITREARSLHTTQEGAKHLPKV